MYHEISPRIVSILAHGKFQNLVAINVFRILDFSSQMLEGLDKQVGAVKANKSDNVR